MSKDCFIELFLWLGVCFFFLYISPFFIDMKRIVITGIIPLCPTRSLFERKWQHRLIFCYTCWICFLSSPTHLSSLSWEILVLGFATQIFFCSVSFLLFPCSACQLYTSGFPSSHKKFLVYFPKYNILSLSFPSWLTAISRWNIGSCTITEVKLLRPWSVPIWTNAWEYQVM